MRLREWRRWTGRRFGIRIRRQGSGVRWQESGVSQLPASSSEHPRPRRGQSSSSLQLPALDPRVAFLITDILSDERARVPAFGQGNMLEIGRPAAAKTGTTTDWRDNWTLGYTPDLTVGVWVGNADNTPMKGVSGISGAGPIWHDFMVTVTARPPTARLHPTGGAGPCGGVRGFGAAAGWSADGRWRMAESRGAEWDCHQLSLRLTPSSSPLSRPLSAAALRMVHRRHGADRGGPLARGGRGGCSLRAAG